MRGIGFENFVLQCTNETPNAHTPLRTVRMRTRGPRAPEMSTRTLLSRYAIWHWRCRITIAHRDMAFGSAGVAVPEAIARHDGGVGRGMAGQWATVEGPG